VKSITIAAKRIVPIRLPISGYRVLSSDPYIVSHSRLNARNPEATGTTHMSDDDYKRAKMKEMGLAPHEIEKAIRQANEDEIYADEVYLYVKDIMSVGQGHVAHTLFIAFWKAIREDLKGCNTTQIALMLSVILDNFHISISSLSDDLLNDKEDKEK
jgi:hypothetical protein